MSREIMPVVSKKGSKPQPAEDEIRFGVLRSMYELSRDAGTVTGSRLGIQELKRRVRSLGFRAAQIQRNVDYLVDNGWLKIERPPYTGKGGKTYPGKDTYRISAKGVDVFEGQSLFQAPTSYHGIDIVNVKGIVQVGTANYARAEFKELQEAFDDLRSKLLTNELISLEEKVDYLSDILSSQAQLLKDKPDSGTMNQARSKLSGLRARLGDLGGAASVAMALERVLELLGSMM